jgi:hypothetical protein
LRKLGLSKNLQGGSIWLTESAATIGGAARPCQLLPQAGAHPVRNDA